MKYGIKVSGYDKTTLERKQIVFWIKNEAGNIKTFSPAKIEGEHPRELAGVLHDIAYAIEKELNK